MSVKKIKACEISFNSMTGLSIRNITFYDFENKIFVIGKERTKRQMIRLDSRMIIKGHLDEKNLLEKKYDTSEVGTKRRSFPPCKDDLERDLSILEEICARNDKLVYCDIKSIIENELLRAKEL